MTNQPLTDVQASGSDNEKSRLTLITKVCGGGSCPTVYRTDHDTFVVQGYVVAPESAGIDVPTGEQLVEIPMELLAEAYRAGA